MDRLLVAFAALVTLSPVSFAQTRIPAEAEPRPATPPAATPEMAEPPATGKVLPRGAVLEEVSGAVRDIDRKQHRLTVGTAAGGEVVLSLDRNTMVYTPRGLGTVLDVAPGAQIRAGRNADFLAYWVQVRAVSATKAPAAPSGSPAPAGGGGSPPGEVPGAGALVAPTGPAPSSAAPAPSGGAPAPSGGAPAPSGGGPGSGGQAR